jgi:hypothetical protein
MAFPWRLPTIDATAQGINQIIWIMRPSKLVAISKSRQRLGEPNAPELAVD